MKKMSYAEAIREGMSIRMREDPNVLLFGEDVGAFGGCFGVSAGMLDEFGEKRVRDTPISEGAIIGAAVGSAATGLRPIAELMFCDFLTVGMDQLVNQAAAEYEERLAQAGLTPVISAPKEPCTVLADGRHLWRILDNLLGNCTKYAMPGTRVYLDVTAGRGTCTVTVKNISADPLNVPADELMKRFVRGDSARSTEGSGLGLSIARNLTTAQKGSFDLVVDGDLFKAIVTLPQGGPQPEQPETKLTLPEPAAPSAPAEGETPADPLGAFLNEIG